MIPPIVFWSAVLASVLYTFGVLLLKRATRWHPGAWRTTFICNWVTAALFLPVFGFGGQIPSPWLLWQPGIVGALFVSGQILSIVALTRGDVSVATPMLGLMIGFDDGLRALARPAFFWVGWGSLLVGLQAVVFTSTIATWGHAAGANVVYSSRGLWTVVLIWAFGAWFSHTESSLGPRVMLIRLLGAASLSLAIFLIL